MTNICPACEVGALVPRVRTKTFVYDGAELSVNGLESAECPVCGERAVLSDQAKRNELRYADARRAHDELLQGVELVALRQRWQITQQTAARLFGGGPNAFSKYERGEVIQSRAMDLLIRVADQFPQARAYLAERAGLPCPRTAWEIADDFSEVVAITRATKPSGKNVAAILIKQGGFDREARNEEWVPASPEYAYGR